MTQSRRDALRCLAYGGAGVFTLAGGGVMLPTSLANAAAATRTPFFVQISDTHIGFNKDANPDVQGTLKQSIALVNALPMKPALMLHTGASHLTKAEEFDTAAELFKALPVSEMHVVPGEHDTTDNGASSSSTASAKPSGRQGLLRLRRRRACGTSSRWST